jgi:DnaK suppressor protein
MTVKTSRYHDLKSNLLQKRTEVRAEIKRRTGDQRTRPTLRLEEQDTTQEEVDLKLIMMKSEALQKLDEALDRLDSGTYGDCEDCGQEISEKRLKAEPFAVRCLGCEKAREEADGRYRAATVRNAFDLRPDMF